MKDSIYARNMHGGNAYAKQQAVMKGQYLQKSVHKAKISKAFAKKRDKA